MSWIGKNVIQKCANPECGSEFLYASRGRLFAYEIRHPSAPCRDVLSPICEMKRSHAAVCFWLCELCSLRFTLYFTSKAGLSVLARPEASKTSSRSPGVVEQCPSLTLSDEC
jgi:hypothetical protein